MFGRKKKKAVDVRTAYEMAQNDGWIIVDVRTRRERKEGHPPGSIHYSLDSLNQRIRKLEGKKVLAICRSGNRSGTAVRILEQNDIEAINVKGGMIAWNRAGLPTKRGK
jgi:rhodanese-related sulfurtransferase